MESISLNLSQILAITWVWQCEIVPKYLPIWSNFGVKCGHVRNPKLHMAAYNSLVDQLCSGVPAAELKYTKGAMSMFACNSTVMLRFNAPLPQPRLATGLVDAKKQLVEPSGQDKEEARKLIRELFSLDENGKPLYRFADFMVYPSGQ